MTDTISANEATSKTIADSMAFPFYNIEMGVPSTGLTKRELIAIAALQGLLGNPHENVSLQPAIVAKDAVEYANALIAELNKATA